MNDGSPRLTSSPTPFFHPSPILAIAIVLLSPLHSTWAQKADTSPRTSPAHWSQQEATTYARLNQAWGDDKPLAVGNQGMIAGTTQAMAIHSGRDALAAGGTAMDAALTVALAQCTLSTGLYVSFAGKLSLLYYDSASGRVYSLNASYDTPRDETDPLTIPTRDEFSGRSVLVPGFMAGIAAAHQRFGKLPFGNIFEPAIYFAEQGFTADAYLANAIQVHSTRLNRDPSIAHPLIKPDGSPIIEGDIIRQPELASMLRSVVTHGVSRMYTGPWARQLINVVQDNGGKLSLTDMAEYRARWTDPLQTTYHGHQLFSSGLPGLAGVDKIEAFNLLESADLRAHGHYTTSAHSMFWLMQIAANMVTSRVPPEMLELQYPNIDLSLSSRTTKNTSRAIWEHMTSGTWAYDSMRPPPSRSHSDAIVAADRWGNVVAMTHTIDTVGWGTGLFVEGVSIPDSASFQQEAIKRAGSGNRLPEVFAPMIVLKDGKPVLACSEIGAATHAKTLQVVTSVLDFGMNLKEANDAPSFLLPRWPGLAPVYRVSRGDFQPELLSGVRAMGQKIEELEDPQARKFVGMWTGIQIDPDSRQLRASVPLQLNGWAEGVD